MDVVPALHALSAYGPAGALLVVVFVGAWDRWADRRARAEELRIRAEADGKRAAADVEVARALQAVVGAVSVLSAGLSQFCRAGSGRGVA